MEPTGSIEDDPNLTNKRFPGNPTKSYRSRSPFASSAKSRIGEGHSPERLKKCTIISRSSSKVALRQLKNGSHNPLP